MYIIHCTTPVLSTVGCEAVEWQVELQTEKRFKFYSQALIHPWLNDEETISRVSELWKGQQLLLTPDQLDHVII